MRWARRAAATSITAGLILAACTGGGEVTGDPPPARGGTLRVGMANGAYVSLDPQGEWSGNTWELLRCCLTRTLMSYDARGGATGAIPKPDLAVTDPEVSVDGLTWTFVLREGVRYAPPLEETTITSADIVRAIERSRHPELGPPGYMYYFDAVEGLLAFMDGETDSIAGLSTPDDRTLVVRLTRPDNTLPYLFAMPVTSPIPPLPSSDEPAGVAAAHPILAFGDGSGYGPYMISTGPYMIEGAAALDPTLPADEQVPAAGFDTWRFEDGPEGPVITHHGSLVLVRNPSWDPGSDTIRAAIADRIELIGGPLERLEAMVASGDLDMVFDQDPTPATLTSIQADAASRGRIQTIEAAAMTTARFNVAIPPFDDLAVRRAVALALDRRIIAQDTVDAVATVSNAVTVDHLAPDVQLGGLLTSWSPFSGQDGAPDLGAAHEAMAESRYAHGDICGAAVCRGVEVAVRWDHERSGRMIEATLAELGIEAEVDVTDDFFGRCIFGPMQHAGLCVGETWYADIPAPTQFLAVAFVAGGPDNWTMVGATEETFEEVGLPVRPVPDVQADVDRCLAAIGEQATLCWARLDQYLMTEVMSIVPISTFQVVRIAPSSTAIAWNDAFAQPALDRLVPTT